MVYNQILSLDCITLASSNIVVNNRVISDQDMSLCTHIKEIGQHLYVCIIFLIKYAAMSLLTRTRDRNVFPPILASILWYFLKSELNAASSPHI